MDKGAPICVVGHTGMVGQAVVRSLQRRGHTQICGVSTREADLCDFQQTIEALQQRKPHYLFLTAGLAGGIAHNMASPVDFGRENALIACNVLEAAHQLGVQRLLYFATSCIYPKGHEQPMEEGLLLTGPPEPTNELYALAKILGVRLCDAYRKQHGSDFFSIAPCNLYGPGDRYDTEQGHLVAALLRRFYEAKVAGREEVVVWGDGTPRRELLFVDDLAEAACFLMEQPAVEGLYNAGFGSDERIAAIAKVVAQAVGYEGRILFDRSRPNGIARKLMDSGRIQNLGWHATTSLEKGLQITYQHFLSEKETKETPFSQDLRYPLASSSWDGAELLAIRKVMRSGRFTMGKEVADFEKKFADYHGVKHALMVNSGSSANLIGVAALSFREQHPLRPGDEVIVPAVGWSTTYFPWTQYGLTLRFVDVEPDTLTLDPKKLEQAITPKTRAVCVVNLLGVPCDFDAIQKICDRSQLLLFEDNCESLGAAIGERLTGTFGICGTFSTFFSHHICTMEGGVVVTDDTSLYHAMLALRAHGWTRQLPGQDPNGYDFVLPGYNLRPTEMAGAIGLEQLNKLDGLLAGREKNRRTIEATFKGIPGVRLQLGRGKSSWFGFALILEGELAGRKQEVVQALAKAGIDTRPIVTGNFLRQPVIKHLLHTQLGPFPVADQLHDQGLFVGNSHDDLSKQIHLLGNLLKQMSATQSSVKKRVVSNSGGVG